MDVFLLFKALHPMIMAGNGFMCIPALYRVELRLYSTTTLFFCGNSVDCMSKRAHVSHTPQSDWKTVTYTRLLRFFSAGAAWQLDQVAELLTRGPHFLFIYTQPPAFQIVASFIGMRTSLCQSCRRSGPKHTPRTPVYLLRSLGFGRP